MIQRGYTITLEKERVVVDRISDTHIEITTSDTDGLKTTRYSNEMIKELEDVLKMISADINTETRDHNDIVYGS